MKIFHFSFCYSYTAMEEQNKQHLCELESKLNAKIQSLEDRIKAMEENCHQDYTWGSARDSYSSLADFNDSDTQSRDLEYTDIQDYEEVNNVDDDSNSFYYSGNEDEAFESSPEYQEAQTGGDEYDIFSASRPIAEREQGLNRERENDEEAEEIVVDDEHESESAFFLNTDAETNNESDGDLNDSLLDSSDGESEGDDHVEGDPVQVYEVSPTSPSAEQDEHEHQDTPIVSQSDDQHSDDVIHIESPNSPHSSTQADDTPRNRTHSLQTVSSRGSLQDSAVSERSSRRTELSSLGTLNVEYGSSGRSSPHEADSVYLSDRDGDSLVVEVGSERGRSNDDGGFARTRGGGQAEPTSQEETHEPEDSGERRHRSRDRSRSSSSNSRQQHRSSRNSSSRDRHSQERDGGSSSRNRQAQTSQQNQPSASSTNDASRQAETESTRERRKGRRKEREFLYGIPIDDSDSNSDPLWERTSLDYSSDVTISDEFSSSYDSDDSSSDTYGKFLQSLHSISSSDSDKTWAPGDPDNASFGSDQEELDYNEDYQPESERVDDDDNEHPDDGDDDHRAGRRDRKRDREHDSSQSSHHSSPGRLDARDEEQESGPSNDRHNSDSDIARRSRDRELRPP